MDRVRYSSLRSWAVLVVLAVLSVPAQAAQRVALLIGNASYAHAPPLANPANDVADIGVALGRLGFSVMKIENAGYAELRRGLLEFQRAASASEMAVVFYAGHGIEVDQRNFLVPVDARLASDRDVEYEAVPLELVQRAVERASGLRLVILDACRENPFAAKMQRAGATRSIGRGLARVEPTGQTLVAYAAKEGTVALDGTGRNSPYSKALLAHLEKPGLEVMLMLRKVRDAVLAATGGQQEPFWYGSLSSRGVYLAAAPTQNPSPPDRPSTADESGSPRVVAERLAAEREFWASAKESEDPADIRAYLQQFPGGIFEALARNRLERLEDADESRSSPVSQAPATSSVVASEARVTRVQQVSAKAELPGTEFPVHRVGDKSVYRDTRGREITYEVTKVDDETYSGHGSDGCSWTSVIGYGPALEWSGCGGSPGTNTIKKRKDGLFPLEVGNKVRWSFSGKNNKGNRWKDTRKCSVKGIANVTVPAGSFDTFKIVCTESWARMEWHYAPELGVSVTSRSKPRGTSKSKPYYRELVSFTPGS